MKPEPGGAVDDRKLMAGPATGISAPVLSNHSLNASNRGTPGHPQGDSDFSRSITAANRYRKPRLRLAELSEEPVANRAVFRPRSRTICHREPGITPARTPYNSCPKHRFRVANRPLSPAIIAT